MAAHRLQRCARVSRNASTLLTPAQSDLSDRGYAMLFCARRFEIAQNYQQCVCLATFITNALSPAGHSLSSALPSPCRKAAPAELVRLDAYNRYGNSWCLRESSRVVASASTHRARPHCFAFAPEPCRTTDVHRSLAGLPTHRCAARITQSEKFQP